MKRIGLFVIVFFCISLLLHASGPRVLLDVYKRQDSGFPTFLQDRFLPVEEDRGGDEEGAVFHYLLRVADAHGQ